jgi:four helix bundle protein
VTFDHEKLDVYKVSLQFVAWAYALAERLAGAYRHARDQLLRASQSIPLNIAFGNGRRFGPDRRPFFEIARGSALECAAVIDVLVISKAVSVSEAESGKGLLVRIVSMLMKMVDAVVRENGEYEVGAKGENEYENKGGV